MIAVISDVHGNYPALEAVLKEVDKLGIHEILSLGDVAGYYCMINECIETFRNREIVNILGNHDSYLLGLEKCTRSNTVNACIEYQKQIVTCENLEYVRQSLIKLDTGKISARHGGWNDPIDEYVDEFDFSVVDNIITKMFCSGHTHIQKLVQERNMIYFNPGSVGQPRDYNNKAAFALVNGDEVELRRVEYDIDKIIYEMRKKGFDDRVSECLKYGCKIGEHNE